jgi:Arc/MetJ family transcription regulator
MKTTIDIADALLRQLRALAARRNTTMRSLVEAALRDALTRQNLHRSPAPLETPTFKGRGLHPGVSWDDWADIRSAAYEGRGG